MFLSLRSVFAHSHSFEESAVSTCLTFIKLEGDLAPFGIWYNHFLSLLEGKPSDPILVRQAYKRAQIEATRLLGQDRNLALGLLYLTAAEALISGAMSPVKDREALLEACDLALAAASFRLNFLEESKGATVHEAQELIEEIQSKIWLMFADTSVDILAFPVGRKLRSLKAA